MYPLVSILTPTWNRADYLDRVWGGLNNQSYQNIEWIVADDGSIDNTLIKLIDLKGKSTFPVTIIAANIHIGKSRMDNEAVAYARGEFILWNDSDDYLLPHAIEMLIKAWQSIPEWDKKNFVGITALCSDEYGVISTKLPVDGMFDTTWNDLRIRDKVDGDMLHFTKAKFLKENRFPEVDFLIPEGVVWSKIGNLKTRVIPELLQIKQYGAINCISFNNLMKYNRGMAYSKAICCKNLKNYPRTLKARIWDTVSFIRYAIHGEISIFDSLQMWRENSSLVGFFIAIPLALLLVIKDLIQGKVRKTHREFLIASQSVEVSVIN